MSEESHWERDDDYAAVSKLNAENRALRAEREKLRRVADAALRRRQVEEDEALRWAILNERAKHATKRNDTIAVDFDGVLHSYTSPWVSADVIPDPPVPGAIDWLNEITRTLTVVVHTTRGDGNLGNYAVLLWLREHGYTGPDLSVTNQKVPALVYLDDRAMRFTGANFPTANDVHRARPWNKLSTPAPPTEESRE